VRRRVRDYIDQSTGLQTITQMHVLAEMVRQFGLVPAGEVLDPAAYKDIYYTDLMKMVDDRTAQVRSGRLGAADFTIAGVVEFLRELRARGVTLYLASGTDRDDVADEAALLGYADVFDGGIYGSVGDATAEAKKVVIDRILLEHHLGGEALAVFGDGPVEIRQARRVGGLAVGVASNELDRRGLDAEKRSRLIEAGAQIVVPDFTQREQLLTLLFGA